MNLYGKKAALEVLEWPPWVIKGRFRGGPLFDPGVLRGNGFMFKGYAEEWHRPARSSLLSFVIPCRHDRQVAMGSRDTRSRGGVRRGKRVRGDTGVFGAFRD